MKIRALALALVATSALPAAAQRYPQLVKTSGTYVVRAPEGFDIVSMKCTPLPLSPLRIVNYSPDVPDPHGPSASMTDDGFCPYYDTASRDLFTGVSYPADGYRDYVFRAYYGSLWDVRPYDVQCNGYMVGRGSTYWDKTWQALRDCCTQPCQTCVDDCVHPVSLTFNFNIYNNAPRITRLDVPSTASCPGTISVHGEAVDDDGGGVTLHWAATGPGGSSSSFTGGTDAVIQVTRSGTWQVRLDADDNEGERASLTRSFTASPAAPSITIVGKSSFVVMNEPIELTVSSPSSDCGTLTTTWDIVSTPPGASLAPQNGYRTGPGLAVFTHGEKDIGTWTFRATSTIAGMSTSKTVTVAVTNLPPEINLEGPHRIEVGGPPATVRTTITEDRDGGALTFDWELMQAPASAGVVPGHGFSTTSAVTVPSGPGAAGTWIFRLTATDNDGAPNSSVTSQLFDVLVDAPPFAQINGPTLAIAGQPVVLDGSGSGDPDSPCPADPARCHVVEPGFTVQGVSPGIIAYAWYVDVPFQYWTRYVSGRVADALGILDNGPTLSIDKLDPGDWVFRLEVLDGEGNLAS